MQDILNYVQLTPDIGTSGQPTEAQFSDIAADGFAGVINIAMPDSDGALTEEGRIVTELGMTYVHIPVPWDAPTEDHLKQFTAAMQLFEGQRVWVHCAMNLRVSAFTYRYLTETVGVARDAARSPILDRWAPKMDDTWRGFLQASGSDVSGAGGTS